MWAQLITTRLKPGREGDLPRLYEQLLDALPPDELPSEDAMDLRRVLYGSHAILRLHFAQEDEAYAWLAAGAEEPERGEAISVA